MHFYGWKKGLKTGMYYLRTKAAADAIKFTVDQESLRRKSSADALKASGNSSLKESGRASPTPARGPSRARGVPRVRRVIVLIAAPARYVVSVRTCVRINKTI